MTFREKLLKEYPEYVDDNYIGGCRNCPDDYGYEEDNRCCPSGIDSCTECWNRNVTQTNREWINSLDNHDLARLFLNDACLLQIDQSDNTPRTLHDVVTESEKDYFWLGAMKRWLDKTQEYEMIEVEE